MIGIVPARGGSKGLRHKNLLTIDGIPLVINAANALSEYCERVLVCTEDAQIASVARLHGYEVLDRPSELADDHVSVDVLMAWVLTQVPLPVMVHQPTVYCPDLDYLEQFSTAVRARNGNYVLGVSEQHLVWTGSVSPERRQRLDAPRLPAREYGVRCYNRPDVVGFEVIIVNADPIFDIDTPYDLDAARRASMRKGRVTMRYAESTEVGSGHRRRIEAIADEVQHLDVHLSNWGDKTVDDYAAVVVNDTLDTTEWTMFNLKRAGARVITLEDLGPGTRHADVVINALYDKSHARYAVLRPEFRSLPKPEIRSRIENILVTFGGTDPSHYTEKLARSRVGWDGTREVNIRVIPPPGRAFHGTILSPNQLVVNPNMAEEMAWADLVISSAGRTIFEAGAVGTPVLCLAHNLREARHAHLGPASGNIFMGIGLDMEVVTRNVRLLQDYRLREEMSEAGRNLSDGRGAERIARIIEDLL